MLFIGIKILSSLHRDFHRMFYAMFLRSLKVLCIILLAVILINAGSSWAVDSDGDIADDDWDNCPFTQNSNQRDSDVDGYGNVCDNCPFVANPDQIDTDGDSLGDACDPDLVEPPCGPVQGHTEMGPLAMHMFSLRIPEPVGDTLPVGEDDYFSIGLFDTGSDQVLIGSQNRAYLGYDGDPSLLDIRLSGLQSVLAEPDGTVIGILPLLLYNPEAETEGIDLNEDPSWVWPPLLGGPVTNKVIAYLDYTITITRIFPWAIEPISAPAISFFNPGDSDIPAPLYYVNLEPFGGPGSGSYSYGQRYYVCGMRFINGSNMVESPASGPISIPNRFLYDTGNRITQISDEVAGALGITASTPVEKKIEVDGDLLNSYIIDRIEIDAADGSNRYVIENALVVVQPDGFGGAADVNIGANYFYGTQVLFDGPGNRLGLFVGTICNEPPICDANGPYVVECEGSATEVVVDGNGSSDPNPGDTLTYSWTTDCPGGSFDDNTSPISTLSIDSSDGCNVTCSVTLTVSDEDGLSDTCETTVTIQDTEKPDITCTPDLIIECDESTEPSNTGMAMATDDCDPNPTINFSDVVTPGDCPDEETITRTWTAADYCGNSISCMQTIEVVDTTPPVIECNNPGTITPPDAPISFTATASDNCDDTLVVEITEFDCFLMVPNGKRIDKTQSCVASIINDTITILDVGGVNTHITWTSRAIDRCGNDSEKTCETVVVNPGLE